MAIYTHKPSQIGVLSLRQLKSDMTKKGRPAMSEMVFVDSKNIEAIGYDTETLELHVRFLKSGETYVYYAVEDWMHQELMLAASKGPNLNANIKPNYQCAKL